MTTSDNGEKGEINLDDVEEISEHLDRIGQIIKVTRRAWRLIPTIDTLQPFMIAMSLSMMEITRLCDEARNGGTYEVADDVMERAVACDDLDPAVTILHEAIGVKSWVDATEFFDGYLDWNGATTEARRAKLVEYLAHEWRCRHEE